MMHCPGYNFIMPICFFFQSEAIYPSFGAITLVKPVTREGETAFLLFFRDTYLNIANIVTKFSVASQTSLLHVAVISILKRFDRWAKNEVKVT